MGAPEATAAERTSSEGVQQLSKAIAGLMPSHSVDHGEAACPRTGATIFAGLVPLRGQLDEIGDPLPEALCQILPSSETAVSFGSQAVGLLPR